MTGEPGLPRPHPPLPDQPDPAAEAVDEPPIDAEELEREIGESESWDEASEKS